MYICMLSVQKKNDHDGLPRVYAFEHLKDLTNKWDVTISFLRGSDLFLFINKCFALSTTIKIPKLLWGIYYLIIIKPEMVE